MDRIRIIGGERLKGTIPISGAKNAALALDDREPAHPRDAGPQERAAARRRHAARPHPRQSRGGHHRRSARRSGQSTIDGQTFKLKAAEIVDTTAPYEMVSRMRASFWVLAPLLARCGEAQGIAARRLRHRHAARRFASERARGAWRRHRARRRLCHRQGAEGPDRRPDRARQGLGRRHT